MKGTRWGGGVSRFCCAWREILLFAMARMLRPQETTGGIKAFVKDKTGR